MGPENVVHLPTQAQALASELEVLQARMATLLQSTEQIPEPVAKTLILELLFEHMPQATNGYTIERPYSDFEKLLNNMIEQICPKPQYSFYSYLPFLGSNPTTDSNATHTALKALQDRLSKATIMKSNIPIPPPLPPSTTIPASQSTTSLSKKPAIAQRTAAPCLNELKEILAERQGMSADQALQIDDTLTAEKALRKQKAQQANALCLQLEKIRKSHRLSPDNEINDSYEEINTETVERKTTSPTLK